MGRQQEVIAGGRYPAVHLARAEWGRGSGASPVVVALECDKKPFNSRGDLQEHAAVIALRGHPLAKRYEPALKSFSSTLRAGLGHTWKVDLPRWPVWKYLDAPDDPWTVGAVANQARSAVLRLWVTAAPEIDRLLAHEGEHPADFDADSAVPSDRGPALSSGGTPMQ